MEKIRAIRWTTIGLHAIVLAFGLVIGALTIDGNIPEAISHAEADPTFKRMLLLLGLVVGGNFLGGVLLMSRLFDTLIGVCCLLAYEIGFFLACIAFLSLDYSVVVGVIVSALSYVALLRKRAIVASTGR